MTNTSELYACLYVREFPAQSLLRLRAELHVGPCVVMDGELRKLVGQVSFFGLVRRLCNGITVAYMCVAARRGVGVASCFRSFYPLIRPFGEVLGK